MKKLARSAFPMFVRCARHQLGEDWALQYHRLQRKAVVYVLQPNLLLLSNTEGPNAAGPEGWTVPTATPMLLLKAG